MYYGISYNKNFIPNNYFANIRNKIRIFYIMSLIIAFLIIVSNYFYIPSIAKAESNIDSSHSEVEAEITTEIDNLLGDIDFGELEELFFNISNKYPEIVNDNSFKDFLLSLISGSKNVDINVFFSIFKSEFAILLKEILSPLLLIFVIILICNIFNFIKSDAIKSSVSDVIYFIALSVIVIIVSLLIKNIVDVCKSSLLDIRNQINIIYPIILTMLTTIGAVSSVSVYSPVLSFFSSTFLNIFTNILLPIFSFIVLIVIVSKLTRNNRLNKMQGFLSSLFKWVIGVSSSVFMAVLSFQGITASARDGLSIKAAKFAIKNYIPLLGGYISDGFEVVRAGSVLIKNAIGYSSIFLLFFTVLKPICYLCILSLGLKLVSASLEPVDNINLSSMLYDISNILKMLVSIVVGVGCMYFFILFLCISTGNTIM